MNTQTQKRLEGRGRWTVIPLKHGHPTVGSVIPADFPIPRGVIGTRGGASVRFWREIDKSKSRALSRNLSLSKMDIRRIEYLRMKTSGI